MNTPTQPQPTRLSIQSATTIGSVYQVVLQDGTILWVPVDPSNADCLSVQAWAQANNVTL